MSVVAMSTTPNFEAQDSISQRVRKLQAEARGLAREHVTALRAALATVEALSSDIAQGGEAYPVGVRDIARRLAEDIGAKAQTLQLLSGR
ncbi:MAG TPA: hypothetical protein VFW47_05405 [Phenylobacterium sp.]|nr:hypothetical protein [Phenylobacterium sp.]